MLYEIFGCCPDPLEQTEEAVATILSKGSENASKLKKVRNVASIGPEGTGLYEDRRSAQVHTIRSDESMQSADHNAEDRFVPWTRRNEDSTSTECEEQDNGCQNGETGDEGGEAMSARCIRCEISA